MPSLNDHLGPLNGATGKTYWRGLEQLTDTPQFRERVENEFPQGFFDQLSGTSRRRFLQVMGASLALAGMTGCRRWPQRELAPQPSRPEGFIPGQAQSYATAFELGGVARPLMVTSYDGRPIKVEGNRAHPASRGAADAFSQASVLELYDPERSKQFIQRENGNVFPRTSDVFFSFLSEKMEAFRDRNGAGLHILCEATSSPTVAAIRAAMADSLSAAKWYTYEPVNRDNEKAGAAMAFGQAVRTHLHLERARVIACFDADLFMRHPDAIAYASDWAKGRRSADTESRMNRVYAAEGLFTLTGGSADHRLAIRPTRIAALVGKLAKRLAGQHDEPDADAQVEDFLRKLSADLLAHRGESVLVAGPQQPPEVHALIHKLNANLGNVGTTVTYSDEPDADAPGDVESIRQLSQTLKKGKASMLLIIGGNPAYDAPADVQFAEALSKARISIHLSLYENETSRRCSWHVPRAHWLEAWGDCRSYDGTVSVTQPLILPLYDGVSAIELLARVAGLSEEVEGKKRSLIKGLDIVRHTFRELLPKDNFEANWQRVLYAGLLEGSGYTKAAPKLVDSLPELPKAEENAGPDLFFCSDYSVYDGRFASNGWLQELPDPMTKLAWDNAAMLSPATAAKLKINTGDLLKLQVGSAAIQVAALVSPGTAADVIGLALGYGRRSAGRVGNGVGFNAYPLRTTAAMHLASGAQITRTGGTYQLVVTEQYHAIETEALQQKFKQRVGELVREASLEDYRHNPHFVTEEGPEVAKNRKRLPLQVWKEPVNFDKAAPHQWAMMIDLSACIGCNACVIACQAENNIPIVGKQEMGNGREMHWIRIDRYFEGDADNPKVAHQPVSCHHCENAPCEQVCPVGATVHDAEGLNAMVYNRCVGTRYCSNNCPYKVRRFNYFDWHSRDPRLEGRTKPFLGIPDQQQLRQVDQVKQMVFNPEVSVRMRGVMEKCTYCVQRIKAAEHVARTEYAQGQRPDQQVRDGELLPACAQTCPTQAITFGNLRDPNSAIVKQKENPRSYAALEELNVRPRTTYLARLRNPADDANPANPKREA